MRVIPLIISLTLMLMTPTHAIQNYAPVAPVPGQQLRAGEISFEWRRPVGDRTPIELQIRKKSGDGVYHRHSIGTRRTKWLIEGSYEWRAFHPAMAPHEGWVSFDVTPDGKIQIKTPVDEITKQEEKIDFVQEKIKGLQQQLLDQMQKNTDLAKRFEQRLKTMQEARYSDQVLFGKMEQLLSELNSERQKMAQKLEEKKYQMRGLVEDEDMLYKAGPRPDLRAGSADLIRVLQELQRHSFYPSSLSLSSWSESVAVHKHDQDYWRFRVRVLGDHALGSAVEQDVVVLWRLGTLQEISRP